MDGRTLYSHRENVLLCTESYSCLAGNRRCVAVYKIKHNILAKVSNMPRQWRQQWLYLYSRFILGIRKLRLRVVDNKWLPRNLASLSDTYVTQKSLFTSLSLRGLGVRRNYTVCQTGLELNPCRGRAADDVATFPSMIEYTSNSRDYTIRDLIFVVLRDNAWLILIQWPVCEYDSCRQEHSYL
jgi:hypothetical protein